MPQTGVSTPRDRRWDEGGGGGLDDVLGVVLIGDPQGDAQVRVRLDLRRHHARRPLRGQHQVHPQRAPAPGDIHQARHEVRQLGDQRRELVNDDHQPRHRLVPRGHGGHIVLNVLRIGPRQLVLTTAQLGTQRLQGPGGQVPVEVGDHPHRVRQARTVLEGRPALVVHEHEGHGLGRVAHAQGGDEGLQQLGLTRTSRPGHQGVRPVGAHIQPELPLGVLPDDRPRRAAAPVPGRQDGVGTGLRQGQHVQQPRGRGDRGVRASCGDVVDRSQRPGHPLAPAAQDQVQGDPLDLVLVRLGDRRRTGPGGHHGPALLGQGRALPIDADQAHPHLGAAAQHRDEARTQPQGVPAVEHHQDLLAVGAPAAAAVGGLQAPLHQVRQLADAPAHRLIVDADSGPGPHALRVAQVGQPSRPGPALLGPLAAHRLHQEHHLQLGRRVQHRGLGRQPGRHLMAPLPAHADHADPTQGHGHRNVRGRPAQRLLVLGAGGVVHLDVAGQVRHPHPQVQPVRIRGTPLPQLGPWPGGAQQQLGRVRGVRAPQPALLGQRLEGRVLGLVALLLVLAQVLPVVLPVVGTPLDQVGDHHDRGEQHEHEGVDAPGDQVHPTPHDQRGEHHGEREGRLARL